MRYQRAHVGRLTHALDWSCQVTQCRASQRAKPESSSGGRKTGRGQIYATRLDAYIVFAAESGFHLTLVVRRTLAPLGLAPILPHNFRRGHLSVILGLKVNSRNQSRGFVYRVHARSIEGEFARGFLLELMRRLHAAR